ncbi:MAG: hypothetical protein AAF402_17010 [Pseudomonadota bacterium]
MINQRKRDTLKTLATAGGALAAAAASPAFAARIAEAEHVKSGITVTYYDNFNGQTVLIRNATDKDILLKKLTRGRVDVGRGSLDLNNALGPDGLMLQANSTQAVSVNKMGEATRYSKWTHIRPGGEVAHTGASVQTVKIVPLFENSAQSSSLAEMIV